MTSSPASLRWPMARPALLLWLAALSSCARGGREVAERPALLSSPIGPALGLLWDRAGGLDRWRSVGAVRFQYRAEMGTQSPPAWNAGPNMTGFPEPKAGEGSAKHLFGPETVGFKVGDWTSLQIGTDGRELFLDDPPRLDAADFALRGIRIFSCLPFVLGEPVWEYRRHLTGGVLPDPRSGFWVVPHGAPSPHSSYYIDLDPQTGVLRAVYYQVNHPRFNNRVLKAVFGRYQDVKGIRVATEITHYLCGWKLEGRYPWESPEARAERRADTASGRPDEAFVLREHLTDIEIIEREKDDEPEPGSPSPPASVLPPTSAAASRR